jgi:hypothetical protein
LRRGNAGEILAQRKDGPSEIFFGDEAFALCVEEFKRVSHFLFYCSEVYQVQKTEVSFKAEFRVAFVTQNGVKTRANVFVRLNAQNS